jgi:hypothetical protein
VQKQRDSIHGISFDPNEQLAIVAEHGSGEPTSRRVEDDGSRRIIMEKVGQQ